MLILSSWKLLGMKLFPKTLDTKDRLALDQYLHYCFSLLGEPVPEGSISIELILQIAFICLITDN